VNKTRIIGLRQDSPGAMRMLAHLQEVGTATRYALSVACHIDQCHAASEIRRMRRAGGLMHIVAWVRPDAGHGSYAPVYAIGTGVDVPKPAQIPRHELCRRYREGLKERFGKDIASKITRGRNNGGADSVVIDGRTVYRRYEGVTKRIIE